MWLVTKEIDVSHEYIKDKHSLWCL